MRAPGHGARTRRAWADSLIAERNPPLELIGAKVHDESALLVEAPMSKELSVNLQPLSDQPAT